MNIKFQPSSAMINTLIFMYDLTKIQPVKLRAFVQYSCVNVKADGSQNIIIKVFGCTDLFTSEVEPRQMLAKWDKLIWHFDKQRGNEFG